ncbi:ornithine aminotransferase [Pseudodesulfovibrio nedwellii]|uniref:Ornithine aminotransferase n=1 Tax=Pseudodesulfovibrio nedwellii TaxID=2973072 RepID=A0ABN6S6W7_9BACT|nr:ornithine--oxo-acid transaminase [Pseudodesulfovibrio nedwellii]BDQ38128.1 ornithine aminotransferase [Pseudodesulfovibrio nedwellii]
MKSDQYILLEDEFGAQNYKPLDVVIERGEGIWVWDVDGNKYMDCLSAYSAVNQGHCNPKIMGAMFEQAKKLTLTSRAFRNDQLGPLYKELCDLTNSHKVLPMNSGAEAVETAIKAVRKWGYQVKGVPENKAEIIVCRNNFHGRTITIISFSTDPISTTGFGPFTPGFKVVDFGDAAAFEAAINDNTVAFLVEPIQGEAGVIIPPDGYLKDIRRICDEKSIVLIFDEIQTGLGRTGALLAEEHEGVEADLTLIGKALSGGFYPVSAVLSNTEVLGVLKPGEHGSTFGGNPLACAVARAALKVLVEDNLIENAQRMGEYFMEGLRKIKNSKIKEVRGRGLLIGVEFHDNAGGARQYCEKLKEVGLLCKETHETIIRFAPPLVITKADINWALERIVPILSQ